MNKKDILLCIILLVISLSLYLIFNLFQDKGNKKAIVYYDSKEVLSIDLSNKEYQEYTVKGYNGDVRIESLNGMVRVKEEVSPLHLCSRQGYISKSYESIICLPNKIVIEIEGSSNIDTIAR